MPGGETGNEVLDRYVPVLTQLRMRYLDDDAWHGDIVVVSHGAAIRLVSAVLAGVDGSFALDHHLANTESVVLAPITDGRWSCRAVVDADAAVLPRAGCAPGRGRVVSQPTRWADASGAAGASERVAVDAERVHHLGGDAAVLGAFGPMPGVVNDGAVAVLQPRQALAALNAHGPFIARADTKPPFPRRVGALASARA